MSTDGGATWQFVNVGIMVIHPHNLNLIYGSREPGVRKSTDGGSTWTDVNTGLEAVRVDGVAQNPRDPNTFFIASMSGFGRTFDNGLNWSWPLSITPALNPPTGVAVALEPSAAYIGGGLDLVRSADNGRTWTASNLRQVVEGDLGSGRLGIQDIGIAPGETGHLFAAVAENPEAQPTPPQGRRLREYRQWSHLGGYGPQGPSCEHGWLWGHRRRHRYLRWSRR